MTTRAGELQSDPRLAIARESIGSAIAEHGAKLDGPRPPEPSLRLEYEALLRDFEDARGAKLFYPYLASGLGRGALVELADGSVKYDFISGIGAHAFGHHHPALVEAASRSATCDTVMQGNLQQNRESAELLRLLLDEIKRDGARLDHGFLASSGAMANENALKIILQRKFPATRMLAFDGAFAGRTLALLSITDNPECKEKMPTTLEVDRVPFFDEADPGGSAERARDRLRALLDEHPGAYAGMHVELVQGESGFRPGRREFFLPLFEILRERGVAIWIDEIQTLGRTTELFAFRHFGLDEFPDVVTIGKLTAVCATFFRSDYRPKPGLVSQTFTASSSAIFAALAIVKHLRDGGFFGPDGSNARLGEFFRERLDAIARRHPSLLSGPFGYGVMIACTVFGGDKARTHAFLRALFDEGVIAFHAGNVPTRVRFLIPFAVVGEAEIEAVCTLLERVLVAQSEMTP